MGEISILVFMSFYNTAEPCLTSSGWFAAKLHYIIGIFPIILLYNVFNINQRMSLIAAWSQRRAYFKIPHNITALKVTLILLKSQLSPKQKWSPNNIPTTQAKHENCDLLGNLSYYKHRSTKTNMEGHVLLSAASLMTTSWLSFVKVSLGCYCHQIRDTVRHYAPPAHSLSLKKKKKKNTDPDAALWTNKMSWWNEADVESLCV